MPLDVPGGRKDAIIGSLLAFDAFLCVFLFSCVFSLFLDTLHVIKGSAACRDDLVAIHQASDEEVDKHLNP